MTYAGSPDALKAVLCTLEEKTGTCFMLRLFLHLSQNWAESSYICLNIKPRVAETRGLISLKCVGAAPLICGAFSGAGGGRHISRPPALYWTPLTLPVILDPCTLRLAF